MPLDTGFEQQQLDKLVLPDLCDLRVYSFFVDNAGGRILNDPPFIYADLPCRLDGDHSGTERVDAIGTLLITDYTLKMGVDNGVAEADLAADAGQYLELKLTRLNGNPVLRFFRFVSYGETTEQGLRTIFVREVLT